MTIQTALLSVSDKTGLVEFAQFFAKKGVQLLSTGGTARALREAGLAVTDVSEHTGFPEMMDGRVKTLHPKIHGGLLALRDDKEHQAAMQAHDISAIDLVVINLYPFEETVARGAAFDECIENIDIGGPSMIRSAAKNHRDVTVVTDAKDYARVMMEMEAHGKTSAEFRRELAAKAFTRTASYDAAIANWFAREAGDNFPATLLLTATRQQALRYGENPHQQAAFYRTDGGGLAGAKQLQGKELSYNNINDTDAAWELVNDLEGPAVAIIKHANPCGVALGDTMKDAYLKALACDSTSAFGGIVALNRPLDKDAAEEITKIFTEVIIAPAADEAAKAIVAAKKNLRLLLAEKPVVKVGSITVKTVSGGVLVQEKDTGLAEKSKLKPATQKTASHEQTDDLLFAFTVAKHVKSNTIVLAKNGATIGIGAGQMSRIDSTRIACEKARDAGFETRGAVLASDAFFPFPDNVEKAAEAGITAIIQPGGSVKDPEVIEAADNAGIAMVFTGQRHFRH